MFSIHKIGRNTGKIICTVVEQLMEQEKSWSQLQKESEKRASREDEIMRHMYGKNCLGEWNWDLMRR